MSQDPQRWISYKALTELAGTSAAERDQDGSFPEHAFEGLRRLGLVGKPPLRSVEVGRLLRVLAAIGRGNLSVGRIYEGHVNALLLIRWFGSPSQRKHLETSASAGALFGVWNADLPDNPVRMDNGILQGAKSFASGADGLTYTVVTAARPEGRQMLIVPVKGLSTDRSWWKPLGMRASGSHVVSFNNSVDIDFILGIPDDYVREPLFSAGVIVVQRSMSGARTPCSTWLWSICGGHAVQMTLISSIASVKWRQRLLGVMPGWTMPLRVGLA
jgi:alkylation response protein AidB-like acyl-CoA dehydrogenase